MYRPKYRNLEERLLYLSYLDNGCWIWLGKKNPKGYGHITIRKNGLPRNRMAHIVSYEVFKDKIPNSFHIDHKCRNKLCINPDHLEPVTPQENNKRKDKAKIKPRAIHGCLYA